RAALSRLRARAAEILKEDGHAASDSTLARVQQTLHALSAIGSFDPDPPGQLVTDRDPPGFDVLAGATLTAPEPRRTEKEESAAEKAHAAEIRKLEKAAERATLAAAEAAAEVARLREALAAAETAAEEARHAAAEAD